ncbi:cytochrome oxidase small assembly protein [Trinickia symbiotica]|uniref:Cytochrome C oxidase assembly protein n=1 Tax=Trinickia symbiotica TaxID=863227 RepID=A0A2N7X463_9BURK|nr:cytochrome oxidase small assembly protein [Trinickia symbiotica]PMS36558.1 cytochrome C oxidase assembly protein [Trinickia symbiotica]
MTRDPEKRRTPAQIRAGNLRLGLILLSIVAAFFLGAVLNQWLFR